MSSLDEILGDLSRGVGGLSARAASTLFASSASALMPAFREWAAIGVEAREHNARVPIVERAIEIGFELATTGTTQADLPALLQRLEWITPRRQDASPGATTAQDCLVCADVAIRVHVDPSFSCGPVVEYLLEPVLTSAMHHVAPASADDPDRQRAADAILQDQGVMGAVGFLWFAIMSLHSRPNPDRPVIDAIKSRAAVLLP